MIPVRTSKHVWFGHAHYDFYFVGICGEVSCVGSISLFGQGLAGANIDRTQKRIDTAVSKTVGDGSVWTYVFAGGFDLHSAIGHGKKNGCTRAQSYSGKFMLNIFERGLLMGPNWVILLSVFSFPCFCVTISWFLCLINLLLVLFFVPLSFVTCLKSYNMKYPAV